MLASTSATALGKQYQWIHLVYLYSLSKTQKPNGIRLMILFLLAWFLSLFSQKFCVAVGTWHQFSNVVNVTVDYRWCNIEVWRMKNGEWPGLLNWETLWHVWCVQWSIRQCMQGVWNSGIYVWKKAYNFSCNVGCKPCDACLGCA